MIKILDLEPKVQGYSPSYTTLQLCALGQITRPCDHPEPICMIVVVKYKNIY